MNETTAETRRAAHQAVLPLAATQMEQVYERLREHPGGLTAGEAAEAASLPLNSARRALTDLLNRQRVTTMGRRICTAPGTSKTVRVAVWILPIGAS